LSFEGGQKNLERQAANGDDTAEHSWHYARRVRANITKLNWIKTMWCFGSQFKKLFVGLGFNIKGSMLHWNNSLMKAIRTCDTNPVGTWGSEGG